MDTAGDEAQRSPWRTTGTREVYANQWIRVREDHVIRPDGRPGIYGVVEPHALALGVVPLFDDGDTLLVGQWRYTMDCYSWEVCAGGGDPRRGLVDEAGRELFEETGLAASRWTALGEIQPSNSLTNERGYLWLAEGLTQHQPRPDGTEELRWWRLPLASAVAMALDGRLTDGLSVVALCRARHVVDGRRGDGS